MVREATKGIAAMTEHSGSEEGGAISAAGEEVIRGLLATLREDMKKEESGGDEVLALDPLVVESQLLSYQHSAASFVVKLQGMEIIGLSEFIIEDVCVNVQTLAVTINLRYDSLLLDGEYDISGKLVKVIPLSTRGPFTVTASNARITLWVKLKTCRGRLEVGQLRSELVVGDVHLDLSHMTGGSLVSKHCNTRMLPHKAGLVCHQAEGCSKPLTSTQCLCLGVATHATLPCVLTTKFTTVASI
ncbi:uncharacterized protein LOC135112006 isoform X4 [Scylla paramamosain]|uniref:uncharacterized protein LOC135112006 isoform X4 n=1 Tax=Scylla paramamosain TaxID=85552 RepID=UPI0030834FBC